MNGACLLPSGHSYAPDGNFAGKSSVRPPASFAKCCPSNRSDHYRPLSKEKRLNSCRFEVGAMARELREKIEIVEKSMERGAALLLQPVRR